MSPPELPDDVCEGQAMKDGIIEMDTPRGDRLGFTCDKFQPMSYLWKKDGYIIVSFVASSVDELAMAAEKLANLTHGGDRRSSRPEGSSKTEAEAGAEMNVRGNFRQLVEKIRSLGMGVKIPTPLGRMEHIVRECGYRHTFEESEMGPVETWVLEAKD